MLCVLWRDVMWGRIFPGPSLFNCASAWLLMPFVCVGSVGAVITIAFFRESHNGCIFTCKTTQVGRCAFGERTGGEEGLILLVEGEQRWGQMCLCEPQCHSEGATWSSQGDSKGDPELCCLAEIERCEINAAFGQQNTGNFRGWGFLLCHWHHRDFWTLMQRPCLAVSSKAKGSESFSSSLAHGSEPFVREKPN